MVTDPHSRETTHELAESI